MNQTLAAWALFLISGSALAGPNAAVFCSSRLSDDEHNTFIAYDIAQRPHSEILEMKGTSDSLPEGQRSYSLSLRSRYKQHIVSKGENWTQVAYTNSLQQRPFLFDEDGEKIGRIVSIVFIKSEAYPLNRKGQVLIQLQEGQVSELKYPNCFYDGALVRNWSSIWAE